ncbi:MAG: septal ring lytic transglycosylase RlpA family protein [Thermoleophilia bacterium]
MRAVPRVALAPLAVIAVGAVAGHAAAAPDLGRLEQRQRAVARQHDRAAAALDEERAALAATRARLDAARTRYQARLLILNQRLRQIYAQPVVSPILAMIGGDPDEAQASKDLMDALAHSDAAMLEEYRRSVVELRTTEVQLQRRKERLAADTRVLAARRARVTARLDAARATARGVHRTAQPLGGARSDAGVVRGLPAAVLRDRALPGATPVDAKSGLPITFGTAPAGPAQSVATPSGMTGDGPSPAGARFAAKVGWYAPTVRFTASGEAFDPGALSAAHRTLPFGTLLRLDYAGREVVVRVNDRGPFVPGRDLDVSPAAAAALGLRHVSTVHAQVIRTP